MNYDLIKTVVELIQQFMEQNEDKALYSNDIQGFAEWLIISHPEDSKSEPGWLGMESGRSTDSIINTLLTRMGRYAKSYSRSATYHSVFSSQDDFIYLISLKSVGPMTKMELIRRNVHEKSSGILIINRLIRNGWVKQEISQKDKRTKHVQLTQEGLTVLNEHMDEIRKASRAVVGNLTHSEQMLFIAILSKLDEFHHSLYRMNLEAQELLDAVYKKLN
ncbi:MarR family winged helix-turn-helix transcriptional regulator [Chryseobacterium proteolyticum]|uniref:MarR family winged helix-turn-helix transcriptional regulator n=1 Tax=Chryseobacterium proteolyticum TaxID=118127 RepID=UPI0039833979